MIHIICNSHYVSHFAAFFIDTGAKISVVESCLWFEGSAPSFEASVRSASDLMRQGSVGVWSQPVPQESSAPVDRIHGGLVPRSAPPGLAV